MMKRLNFTLDLETIDLLNRLSDSFYGGNKSRTIRAALESLAAHTGHDGWVITGYTSYRADSEETCHNCGHESHEGEILFKPVFERGKSPAAMQTIPGEVWLECGSCVEDRSVTPLTGASK